MKTQLRPLVFPLLLLALLLVSIGPARAYPKVVKRIETKKPDGLPEYVRFEGAGLTSVEEVSPEDAKKHFGLKDGPELIIPLVKQNRTEADYLIAAFYGLRSKRLLKALPPKEGQKGDYRVATGVFTSVSPTLIALTDQINDIKVTTTWHGEFAVFGRDDPSGIIYYAERGGLQLWNYTYLDIAMPPHRCGYRELDIPYVCVFKEFLNIHKRLRDGSFYADSQNSLLRISDQDGSFVRNGFVRRMKTEDALRIKQQLEQFWSDPAQRWRLNGKQPMTEAMRRIYRSGRPD